MIIDFTPAFTPYLFALLGLMLTLGGVILALGPDRAEVYVSERLLLVAGGATCALVVAALALISTPLLAWQ